MEQERIIWGKGVDRSRDPRYIDGEYDIFDMEVIERDSLFKRKGFGRWRADGQSVLADVVRGIALMYDSDENRYLFVFRDGAGTGTDLWIEKDGGVPLAILNFFPSKGYRVRSAVFGDRIYFVNGVDRPRWYREYDDHPLVQAHFWGIAGVPSPARWPADESSFDYFISRALYVDCITSSEGSGIDPPGIWRYKQTIGYYGKQSDQQVEESNAGPASKMFHCQFNTAEALGTQLQGYIEKGIPIGIADFDDLILDAGESGGQDYSEEIRWMRFYRQWKMFSDELYSPFEHLVEMKKGWPTSINDVYRRDSAVVAPTTRVSIPVAHHIENANNRMFLGRIQKELFTQPGLPNDFRGISPATYKPDFSYRWSITIQNTNSKTLTSAIIPIRLQNSDDTKHVATPPAGGGTWTGAYIDWNVLFHIASLVEHKSVFVDEDGITPLGFVKIAATASSITYLVEIPEIAAGGSRSIYFYGNDASLSGHPAQQGEPGHWESLAHYPLCASDHWLLVDFENWDSALAVTDVTQKRSLAYFENPIWSTALVGTGRQEFNDHFFNRSWFLVGPSLRVYSTDVTIRDCGVRFYPPVASSTVFSVAFYAKTSIADASGTGDIEVAVRQSDGTTVCARFRFYRSGGNAVLDATVYGIGGASSWTLSLSEPFGNGSICGNGDWLYYLLTVDGSEMVLAAAYGDQSAHAGEGAAWDDATNYNLYSTSRNDLTEAIRFDSTYCEFGVQAEGSAAPTTSTVNLKEVQILGRKLDGADELLHMLHRDTYFPNHGLATVDDLELATGEKHPDRMYFSKLNQPNSFEATDFRDMGELGRPIQGIKGIHNRLFVFDENKIRALFSAGAEQALTLVSGDTTMWNLSQDLTGEIGGLGVLAPDTLVTMEFAGRDGVGFLSHRGFYFFDGQSFAHISEKIDESIRDHIDSHGKDFAALFIKKKRQLLITPTDFLNPNPRIQVANMKFATGVDSIIWTEFAMRMKFGVELDEYIDDGDFVFISPYISALIPAQILKLEGNTGADTYVDIRDDGVGNPVSDNVVCGAKSKYFDLKDAEMLHVDIENEVATPSSSYLVRLHSDISGSMAIVNTLTNPKNGENRFPIGTHARTFMVQVVEGSSSGIILRTVDLYFNVHGRRRV